MLEEELGRRGLPLAEQDIWSVPRVEEPGEASEAAAQAEFELGRRVAHATDRPTAVVAWTEPLASRFIAGFQRAGGRVPDDLSVLTYNNTRCAGITPLPLTAVGVPVDSLAETIVDLAAGEGLAAHKSGERPVRQVKMPPRLVIRESIAPPPAAGR
jgi:DNA-binding LacI/PurR family transcriptional regulator